MSRQSTATNSTVSTDSLNRGDLVSCDECGARFRVIDLGHKLSAMGNARVVEHFSAQSGEKCDVAFYCSDECSDKHAPPGLALATAPEHDSGA